MKATSIQSNKIFCTCLKTHCQKNYCDCFKANIKCNDKCRCVHCFNRSIALYDKSSFIIENINICIKNNEFRYNKYFLNGNIKTFTNENIIYTENLSTPKANRRRKSTGKHDSEDNLRINSDAINSTNYKTNNKSNSNKKLLTKKRNKAKNIQLLG